MLNTSTITTWKKKWREGQNRDVWALTRWYTRHYLPGEGERENREGERERERERENVEGEGERERERERENIEGEREKKDIPRKLNLTERKREERGKKVRWLLMKIADFLSEA